MVREGVISGRIPECYFPLPFIPSHRGREKRLFTSSSDIKDPFNSRLRTHKLTGRLEGLWAFSVSFDCRVIFKFLGKTEILMIDIGGHDEVY